MSINILGKARKHQRTIGPKTYYIILTLHCEFCGQDHNYWCWRRSPNCKTVKLKSHCICCGTRFKVTYTKESENEEEDS